MTPAEKILQLNQYLVGGNKNNIVAAIKEVPAGIASLIYFNADPVFRNQLQNKAYFTNPFDVNERYE